MRLFAISLFVCTVSACDEPKQIEENQEPVFIDFSISPTEGVLTSSQLICVATAEDANNDSLTIDIQWTLDNGDVIGNTSIIQLTPDIVSPNDNVTCTATLTDELSEAKTQSGSVTVENTLPEISSVSIEPSSGITVVSTLTCSALGSDADDEELAWSYAWSANGEDLGSQAELALNSDVVGPEDVITCTATVTDESGGTVSETASVSIGNTAPEIGQLVLSPSHATSQDPIECIASDIIDLDGDDVDISYSWSIDGSEIEENTASIDGPFAVGSEVVCVATPNDGTVDGESMSASVTIQNTEPVISSVSITPSTDVEANTMLLCAQTSSDVDNGDLSVSYVWTDDQGNTLGGDESVQLDPSSNHVGDEITCTVTVSDEYGASATQSESVTIVNTEPAVDTATGISGTATTGSTLTCTASFLDLNDGALTPTYSWTTSDGTEIGTSSDYVISSTEAGPGDSLTCTATATDMHGAVASSTATITVDNTDPVVDTEASISGTATTGSTLTCVASFSDLDDGALTPTYSWTTSDGTEIGTSSDYVISSAETDPGDNLTCTATGTDMNGATASSSATSIVKNSPPSAPELTLTAGDAYILEDDVLCSVTTESADADDQTLEYIYTWVDADGVTKRVTGPTIDLSDTLPASSTGSESWSCNVVASDGIESSVAGSAAITLTYSSEELNAGDLIITELMYNPTAVTDSNGEWIEVYNNTASTINLLGLQLSDDQASTTIDEVVMIAAGAYAVLANNEDSATNGGVTVDYEYESVQLNNSGEQYLSIGNTNGTLDRIDWDNAGVTMPDTSAGSIILSSDMLDATANDSGDYWCTSTSVFGDGDYGSPGEANADCDADGDGVYAQLDCDDGDDTLFAVAGDEDCDGILTGDDCDDADDTVAECVMYSSIVSGSWHTCAVKDDGAAVCWGANYDGEASPPAETFSQLTIYNIHDMGSGGHYTCGIKTDGYAECWGANYDGEGSPPTNIAFKAIDAGSSFACGVATDNTLHCWGANYNNELSVPSGSYSQVSSGYDYVCAISDANELTCWGDGWTHNQASIPSGEFIEVSVGYQHSCAIQSGTQYVQCWGSNNNGECSPPAVEFQTISAGYSHNCGVTLAGDIQCWGSDWDGEGSPPSGTFIDVSVGTHYSCGIRVDGSAECWGADYDGETSPP